MREQLFILYMHTDKTAAKKLLAMVLQNLRWIVIDRFAPGSHIFKGELLRIY